jgi:transcription initiation factor TFIIIB Brf1 subunit/transcription initiation factor TFIIB
MQADNEEEFCTICAYRRPRVPTYSGDGKIITSGHSKLGSSLSNSLNEAEGIMQELEEDDKGWRPVNPEYVEKIRRARERVNRWQKSNPEQSNIWHFINITCAAHPEIGKWFADLTVPRVIRDNVEVLYKALLGHIQGKRPEYVMTVLVDIVYSAHRIPFDPPQRFLREINWEAYIKTWNDIWEILREKGIRCLRTPTGSIELKKRRF